MTRITIAHLYPQEMNIYGDTGNVLVLRKRLAWRGIEADVVPVGVGDSIPANVDIIMGGGGQDAAQGDIGTDFVGRRDQIAGLVEDGVVMLAICGAYQLLGHEFRTHTGTSIPGIGVLDLVTHGSNTRLIGNHAVDTEWGKLVGYENHSGLTKLGEGATPLATTITGRGNDGADGTEGCVYRNVFGTYLHGPVLAKSPAFADELLRRALERQGADTSLAPLDDSFAMQAAAVAVTRPR